MNEGSDVMSILSAFNRQKTTERLELEIVLAKLKFLASTLENNTDKLTDEPLWQDELSKLVDFKTIDGLLQEGLIDSYYTLYHIFRHRHFRESS